MVILLLFAVLEASAQAPRPTRSYIESVNRALLSDTDFWGEQALARPDGPTYDFLKDRLTPLMHLFKWYSETEIYYLPFGMQDTVTGGADFALHYADGGQIVTRRSEIFPAAIPDSAPAASGKRTTFYVGRDGRERYGSDLGRLHLPTLGEGYLPILQTAYTDAAGLTYTQESFATRIPETTTLVSFIKITANRNNRAQTSTKIRVHFSRVNRKTKAFEDEGGLILNGNRVQSADGNVFLIFSPGATLAGADLTYTLDLSDGKPKEAYLIRFNNPGPAGDLTADAAGYISARTQLAGYWDKKLASGAQFIVPEQYAMDAQKNLIIQNLLMNILYSIGNPYEVHFNAEGHDSVQALGYYGFLQEYKAGLDAFMKGGSSNYEKGERMLHAADYYFLTRDRSLVDGNGPKYEQFAADFTAEMAANDNLLRKEIAGTDIGGSTLHYNTHHQAVVWRGWRDMLKTWELLGRRDLTQKYGPTLRAHRSTLLKEMAAAQSKLPDGSIYIPNVLREKGDPVPFDPIHATKEGAYWLLVATDGFATGIHDRATNEAILKYLHNHGGTLMGLIRFNYTGTPVGNCNTNGLPGYEVEGVDNAYLTPYVQFLAQSDFADRLVLSFYGKLAHGMTRNTFLAGEGESVGVCEDPSFVYGMANKYYRTLYLSPNSTNNSAYLLALRYMLVRESQEDSGTPDGLYLAYATPRPWLQDGKTIAVKNAPTYFGVLNYRITSHLARNYVESTISVPTRDPIRKLKLRLRVPGGATIKSVLLNGAPYANFNVNDETIDLTGKTGTLDLRVNYDGGRQ
ncbi:MAG: hypothetical protein ACE14L_10420 [Terriglobales bacterium]